MIPLLGVRPEALAEALTARGVACSLREARQVLSRVVSEGRAPEGWRGARKLLVEGIARECTWALPEVIARVPDPADGSLRYLFRFADGATAEAVRIPLEKPDRFSVCLSSQAGCAMGCAFCATGRLGLTRHLLPHEIVGQLLVARAEAPGRVTGAVFMGQGEPFHNYDAVIEAARVLCDPCGGRIPAEAITISTVGLVPQLRRYTAEGHPFRLVVSLTSAVPERRAALLPVAGRVPLPELVDALRGYVAAWQARRPGARVRVTVAWVTIGGVNTGDDEVAALREALGDLPIRLNLIDVNDARPDGFRRATEAELGRFRDGLQALRVPVVRRYSVGAEQNSACGMLAGAPPAEVPAVAVVGRVAAAEGGCASST